MRRQPYSSTRTCARSTVGIAAKCLASRSANSSTGRAPPAASAYTVFFCASVVSTPELSPVR